MCVANLSRFAQYVELDLSRFGGRQPVEMIGRVHFPRIGDLPYLLTLGPHDFFWFELTDGDGLSPRRCDWRRRPIPTSSVRSVVARGERSTPASCRTRCSTSGSRRHRTSWRQAFVDRPPESAWRPWVAERDGAVIGFATTTPAKADWLPPPPGAGELTNLYLDPDAIGTGVGSALYDHAAADLRERGFNPFVVWAFRDNYRARRFYERKGLVIDVPEHDWILGGVRCPIVRFRIDWPVIEAG